MIIDVNGSCLCESVTFSIKGEVTDFYLCHCKRCQKETGTAFSTSLFVPLNAIAWRSGNEIVKRFELPKTEFFCLDFCTNCGSVVPYLSRNRKFYIVPVGIIDGNLELAPLKQLFWKERASWYDESVQCQRFDSYPASEG